MAMDWLALPLDILSLIAMKLETLEDFIYFFVVCRLFRNHVLPLIKNKWRAIPEPWLLLAENTKENPNCLRKIFNLHNNKCYQLNLPETFGTKCWGSAYGWIAMVDRDLNIQLFNPLTKAQICFPSLKTLPDTPEISVKLVTGEDFMQWFLRCYLTKLVVLKVSQNGHHEFVIMVLYKSNMCLAFARHGDPSWTSVYIEETSAFIVDVVGIDGDVFALYDDGAIGHWNVKEISGFGLVYPMVYSSGKREIFEDFDIKKVGKMYLVQLGIDLLMVLRYKKEVLNNSDNSFDFDVVYQTTHFKVYRLNPIDKNWEKIEDLGDVALFVGENSSISISVARAKCLQCNCIYFTDDENEWWSLPTQFGGHDMGVFDMKCGRTWRFYEGVDTRSLMCPPTLFIPQL